MVIEQDDILENVAEVQRNHKMHDRRSLETSTIKCKNIEVVVLRCIKNTLLSLDIFIKLFLNKKPLRCPTPFTLFTRHFPFRLLLVPIDDSWTAWAVLPFWWRCQNMGTFFDGCKGRLVFQTLNLIAARKIEKLVTSDGQYF